MRAKNTGDILKTATHGRGGASASSLKGRIKNWRAALSAQIRGGLGIQLALIAGLCLLAVLLSYPVPETFSPEDVAPHTIRADRDLKIHDPTTTEARRLKAAEEAIPVYVIDDVAPALLAADFTNIFAQGREYLRQREAGLPSFSFHAPLTLEDLQNDFNNFFDLSTGNRFWEAVLASSFDVRIERQVLNLALEILSQGLLQADQERPQRNRPVSVITLSSQHESFLPSGSAVLDQPAARRLLDVRARLLQTEFSPETVDLITHLAYRLLQGNMRLDQEETQFRRDLARESVPEAYYIVRAGEVIVREGSQVTPEVELKLRALLSPARDLDWALKLCGFFLILFIFFSVTLVLFRMRHSGLRDFPLRRQILFVILLALVVLMAYASGVIGRSLTVDFDFLNSRAFYYLLPIPAVTMIIAIFFGPRQAGFMALFASIITTSVAPGDSFYIFLYTYNGSVAAIWCLRSLNERSRLVPASFWVALVNCLTLLGLMFFDGAPLNDRQMLYNFSFAVLSGLLSGIVASGLMPLVEMIFGFATNLKMLELGNLDRPLLRELMLAAPGTYHHSVIVGAMVEAAAEAIRANPHLAKVGAHYHDLGKFKKPLYFVENQSGENKHDALSPSMSALVLIGHVKDGVELAQTSGLPRDLIDIIEQHHGTSLMSFFYHKAKEARQPDQPEINESDFRYPGPKPRSKEAGLVMLADICEAATRSLSEPTPAKVANLVRHLANQVYNDGQLDECELSLRELAAALQSFNKILTGIYHHRVAYPAQKEDQAEAEAKMPAEAKPATKGSYAALPEESTKRLAH